MRPRLHPRLVNDRFGDPGLFVGQLHGRAAMLLDLGDLTPLSARDLLRVDLVAISHRHIDHFIGFDALMRVHVGRAKTIRLVGPAGTIAAIGHKLAAYEWDLVDRYEAELRFDVSELVAPERLRTALFRLRSGFAREDGPERAAPGGVVAEADGVRLRAVPLAHHGVSLGFALEEPRHVNVWRNRLAERGLAPGAWLQPLKAAVREGAPDDRPIKLPDGGSAPLGALRDLVAVVPGSKIAYVTDVADTPANRAAIAALARQADILFIESRFAAADAALAADRAHLTTRAAGEIAAAAGAARVEPFHFSPRYRGEEARLIDEVRAACPLSVVTKRG